jgi:hypothetical protein
VLSTVLCFLEVLVYILYQRHVKQHDNLELLVTTKCCFLLHWAVLELKNMDIGLKMCYSFVVLGCAYRLVHFVTANLQP